MGKHKTPKERIAIIEDFYNRGVTQTKFCEENNLSRTTLHDWLKEYNKENSIINSNLFYDVTSEVKNNNLIESQGIIKSKEPPIVDTPTIKDTKIKIKHPTGVELEFDVSIFKEVVKYIL